MDASEDSGGWVAPARKKSRSRPGLLRGGQKERPQPHGGRFTIMVIPHSDRKVAHVHIPGAVVFISAAFLVLAILAFVLHATGFSVGRQEDDNASRKLASVSHELDAQLRDFNELRSTYQQWQEMEGGILDQLSIRRPGEEVSWGAGGDLAFLEKVQELSPDEIREIHDVRQLSRLLAQESTPLSSIARVLIAQKSILADIPNLWPVSGGSSRITMEFGPHRHPVTGRWFIHQGIDISALQDLPVVASANGKVVEATFDSVDGYGAYVLIEHKNSVRTRYAHLGTFVVKPGDEVYQGQIIGTLGSSGLTTGHHLEFQIMIGTSVLDPAKYLKQAGGFQGS